MNNQAPHPSIVHSRSASVSISPLPGSTVSAPPPPSASSRCNGATSDDLHCAEPPFRLVWRKRSCSFRRPCCNLTLMAIRTTMAKEAVPETSMMEAGRG
uniref:Uncharacterized protein n=1 Tax=Oryza sativa subsp. japonica TaxID=39947 RepID=Q9FP04_ORYSJ|nr:hypothetical protein [Oryza sativa Japonica Group]